MYTKYCYCVVMFFFYIHNTNSYKKQNFCSMDKIYTGMCVPFQTCTHIKQVLRQTNDLVKVCDVSNSDITICCPVSEKIITPQTGNGITVPNNQPVTQNPTDSTNADNTPPQDTSLELVPLPSEENPTLNPSAEYLDSTTTNPSDASESSSAEILDSNKLPVYQKKCKEYQNIDSKSANLQVQIVGGIIAKSKEFPHMAALGFIDGSNKLWLCGGSLISENYVLTAAHCLISENYGEVHYVLLGTNNIRNVSKEAQEYIVTNRLPHPQYNSKGFYNDIALLKLDRPVAFSEYIKPICLASKDVTSGNLIATGWGKMGNTENTSDNLLKVVLEWFDNEKCQETYKNVAVLTDGIKNEIQICAGSKTEQKDTCQGDSGGPLHVKINSMYYLIGTTSFGIRCGQINSPGVYSRVPHFISWIEEIVWNKK